MRKDFVSKVEEMKDIEELIEAKRKVLKTWRIVNVITFCIFLVIILIRCSAGLNRGTVITDNPAPPTDYSVTIGRIDIGVNKDIELETNKYYLAAKSNTIPEEMGGNFSNQMFDDFYNSNEYYVKSTSYISQPVELGEKITIDSSDGVNASEYRNLKTLEIAHSFDLVDGVNQVVDNCYRIEDTYPNNTGISMIAVYDRKLSESEINEIASTLAEKFSNDSYNWADEVVSASHFFDDILELTDCQIIEVSADGSLDKYIEDFTYDVEVYQNIPQRTVVVYNIDKFFFACKYHSYHGCSDKMIADGFHH